jgi:hypothetical protein
MIVVVGLAAEILTACWRQPSAAALDSTDAARFYKIDPPSPSYTGVVEVEGCEYVVYRDHSMGGVVHKIDCKKEGHASRLKGESVFNGFRLIEGDYMSARKK